MLEGETNMKRKILRATGKNFGASRKKLERKIRLHQMLGWKKEGNFEWEKEGTKVITSHEVVKW